MVAKGDLGIVKVGHQRAITLRRWTLDCPKDTLGEPVSTVVATVESADTYWSTVPPTSIGLWMGEVWWKWSRVELVDSAKIGGKSEFRLTGDPDIAVNF